ncbi:MAG: hypothetical protein HKO85_06430 [Xanthomonadales bacterium]|nr:hypothetical protein [Gammaproteobacteria bacterium]MBT8051117.1 hypothetical protein [Gammaproteobacteria bacterium]MBT8057017.1 hypothetical protein [Gammaproteobacteria bacterium]NNJ77704.1 hypothetical protein [Xanthomonadales bacterium]NNL04907.1 hypothetical protein [Xanthomonadales bacterium]
MPKIVKMLMLSLLSAVTAVASAAPVGYSINSDGPDDLTFDSLYRIDLATGAETRIGRVNSQGVIRSDVEGLAFAPDGTLYGVDDEAMTLFPINPDNGFILAEEEVVISGLPFGGRNDFGMTFTCDGSLYVTSVTRGSLYRLGLDGKATLIGTEGSLGANISAIAAYGENPVQLYGLGNGLDSELGVDSRSLFQIDIETGTAAPIGPLGAAAGDYSEGGLAFDDQGQLWAITDRRDPRIGTPLTSQVMKLDTSTGNASAVQQTGEAGFESLAITVPRGCATSGGDTAQFTVQKAFADGNDSLPATLNIQCTSGLPLQQSITTQPGSGPEVTFTVSEFTDGELDCVVWEDTPGEYFATYECFSTGTCEASQTQCAFTGVSAGQENLCVIRNYPEAVQLEVASTWVGGEDVEFFGAEVLVDLRCRNILGGDGTWQFGEMAWSWLVEPDSPAQTATVEPRSDGTSECRVVAMPQSSAIESTSDCQDWTPLFPGGDTLSCTVTNTIFFEGIPSLGRGGLILTALLLLFTGLVFVRRF